MKVRPHLKALEDESYERDITQSKGLLDCGVARNNFGVSERVSEYVSHYSPQRFWDSPDISYSELKQAICRLWSPHVRLKTDNVKIGNASRFIQERFNKIFVGEGTKIIGFSPQYSGYVVVVAVAGGIYESVPLSEKENFRFKVEGILGKLTAEHALVFIDNPSNPTGQLISLGDIEAVAKEARKKGAVVLVDEAFADYVPEENSAICLIDKYENVAVTRTFSKAYGLGKVKVGYAILPGELAMYYDKVSRGVPGPVSDLGARLAVEALDDQAFVKSCRERVIAEKARVTTDLLAKGYRVLHTHEASPIFVLGHQNKEVDLRGKLLQKGILSVSGSHFNNLGKNYVRITLPSDPGELLNRLQEE